MMKVSIIVVCLNARSSIEDTMKSIFRQTYRNREIIVVDGGSLDGTREYLATVREHLSIFISEPDSGIYSAMNKGISFATGSYIIFMNSGDRFVSDEIIETVFADPVIVERRPKLISGQVQYAINGQLTNYVWPMSIADLYRDICLAHQATFIDARLQRQNLFDERYKFAGDYELWRRLHSKGHFDLLYVPLVIAVFSIGGISNTVRHDATRLLERAFINYQYSGQFTLGSWLRYPLLIISRRLLFLLTGRTLFFKLLRFIKTCKRTK